MFVGPDIFSKSRDVSITLQDKFQLRVALWGFKISMVSAGYKYSFLTNYVSC